MGDLFQHKIVCTKKYESLNMHNPLQTVMFYDDFILKLHPDWQSDNKRVLESLKKTSENIWINNCHYR